MVFRGNDRRMNRDATVFGGSIALVVVGLAVLLFGEYGGADALVVGGGVVVLAGVGVGTAYLAWLPEAASADRGGH